MTNKLSVLRILKKSLLTIAAIFGLAHVSPDASAAVSPEAEKTIEQRIADVRERFEIIQDLDTEKARKFKEISRLSQWFNFPNWPNWPNWRNWPNQRWLNW